MRIAYFIARENLAIKKFQSLLELLHLNEASKTLDLTHFSEKSFRDMIETLSFLLQRSTLDRFRRSEYFSILVDESMDSSKQENIIIYVRYFDTEKTLTVTEYACTRKLTKCDAQGIFDTVNSFMLDSKLPYRKLMCLGSDGASVMVGSRNSLLQDLKKRIHS
jgi:Fic family protein